MVEANPGQEHKLDYTWYRARIAELEEAIRKHQKERSGAPLKADYELWGVLGDE